jgi:hypothetical protein
VSASEAAKKRRNAKLRVQRVAQTAPMRAAKW